MSRLTTSNLIRFSPGAGDGSDESDPVSRFELSLATRLDGVTQWSTYSGAGLSAALAIAFEPILTSLCERLRLTGITAPGHADLSIPGAAYNDSTCAYSGPENSDPLTVYLDQDPESTVTGWTLKIHWPNQNWYPDFDWPGPLYAEDPPFEDDEQRPPKLFKLKSFEAHTSRWTEDDDGTPTFEDYGGVRIPMQLVIDPGKSRPVRVVKDLTGEDCPVLTGGGTSIRLNKGGPVFEVTMREIADALTGLTDLYGSDDREGTYPLKWIVYKGDGDMVYEAECYTGASLGTYTDRRSGTSGLFETDNKVVAQVTAMRAPLAFARGGGVTFDADKTRNSGWALSTMAPASPGRYWIGTLYQKPVAVTWNDSKVYVAQFPIYAESLGSILAASVRDGTPPLLQVLRQNHDGTLALIRKTLAAPSATETHAVAGDAFRPHAARLFQFSPDAASVIACEAFADGYDGGLLRLSIPAETADLGDFTRLTDETSSYQYEERFEETPSPYPLRLGDFWDVWDLTITLSRTVCYGWRFSGAGITPLNATLKYERNTYSNRRFVTFQDPLTGVVTVIEDAQASENTITVTLDEQETQYDQTYDGAVTSDSRRTVRRGGRVVGGTPQGQAILVHAGAYQASSAGGAGLVYTYDPAVTLQVADGGRVETTRSQPFSLAGMPERPDSYAAHTYLASRVLSPASGTQAWHVVDSANGASRLVALSGTFGTPRVMAIDGRAAQSYPSTWIVPTSLAPCLWAPQADFWPEIPTWSARERPTAQDLLEAINAARTGLELGELTLNADLSTASALHGAWMEETGAFSSTGRSGSQPLDRAQAAGYRGESATSVAEILAGGHDSVSAAMIAFESDPAMWAVITDPTLQDLGALVWPSGPWAPFLWVVVLGKRS